MKVAELNRIAAWLPISDKELNTRDYEEYNYLEKGILKTGRVTRYAKNYTIDRMPYSLLVVSQDDPKDVEKRLDEAKLDESDVLHIKSRSIKPRYING